MVSTRGKGTILIVDDAESIRWMLTELFTKVGFEVETVANGSEALTYLAGAPVPEVIILDLSMPVMSGYEFLSRCNQSEFLLRIPIIIYSSDVETETMRSRNVVAVVQKGEKPTRLIEITLHTIQDKRMVG